MRLKNSSAQFVQAVEAIGFLMIDALHFELAVQGIPRAAFVGVDDGAGLDASLNEADGLTFRGEHGRH
jgi:hypothetical protein